MRKPARKALQRARRRGSACGVLQPAGARAPVDPAAARRSILWVHGRRAAERPVRWTALVTAVAHLLCGKTGSGKTTLARDLESQGSVRFTLDEWMIHLYGHHMPREVFDARVDKVMHLILDLSVRLVQLNISVVLDCGFWSRASRAEARQRLRGAGAKTILHFFQVPDAELRARLARRNSALRPGTFEITPEMFNTFSEWFEAPREDEDDLVIESAA